MGYLAKSNTLSNKIFNSDPDETASATPVENLVLWVVLAVAALALIFA